LPKTIKKIIFTEESNNKIPKNQSEGSLISGNVFSLSGAKDTMASAIKIFLEVIKFKITVLVSFTTGLGYILASQNISFGLFYPIAGIFLLACSASALNHYQERETDKLMTRTRKRPIPSGRVKPSIVLIISAVIFFIGAVELLLTTNVLTLAVGLMTFIWYNGIYTPLKKKTAWAIIPGSLVGALPPIAGWTAAGGDLLDPKILIVGLYFFIWQIPHFWLLLMLYGEDYHTGGFPTLNEIFSPEQLKRITFMWLVTTVTIAMMIPLFGIIHFGFSNILLFAISVWMVYNSFVFLKHETNRKLILSSFLKINFYTLLLITVLSLDKFISLI
jgi:protoheme IX farnesyltransferase